MLDREIHCREKFTLELIISENYSKEFQDKSTGAFWKNGHGLIQVLRSQDNSLNLR